MEITILIVDDEDNFRDGFKKYLSNKGYVVYGAENLTEARRYLKENQIDIVLLDVQIGKEYGPDLLDDINLIRPKPITILLTAYGEVDIAVTAMKNGAFDFMSKPLNLPELEKRLKQAEEIIRFRKEMDKHWTKVDKNFDFVEGKNLRMKRVFQDASRAARAGASVLIYGETGSGKEIVAKYIYKNGSRANKPMVAVNCAAISPNVLESELFGHEAGSFTGATAKTQGLFEQADGGILFLDEISSMSLEMQAKILRAIEEKKIRRVGGTKEIPVDVQIIAASNRDLLKMIEEKKFRDDLYYRLRVVDIDIPPLRERTEDMPELAAFFITMSNREHGLNIQGIAPQVLKAFQKYNWPGNLRELRNVIERACIFCLTDTIELCDIDEKISGGGY
ncbi:MAG: sigma-54-dependent Fis family transcriptional regulator [Anaerolineaceae bacterium]|nr:sigma-54-dependent Fis family transcriptional regulator [Anaerolineaceae bacterium]